MKTYLNKAKFFLAPMEGVTDFVMRELLTSLGGIDVCVSEFLRVTEHALSSKVILRDVPEAECGWKTASGTPVIPQILGGNPEKMAQSALNLAKLGAPAVDINFGCPAKTVNRNDGGAILLTRPDRMHSIISAVKEAVNPLPVSVKIRLGWNDIDLYEEILSAINDVEPAWLTIHARTKADGYSAPARWDYIRKAVNSSKIKIVANGDIRDASSYQKCIKETGCTKIMIGRAVLRDPFVFKKLSDKGFRCGIGDVVHILESFIRLSKDHYGVTGAAAGRLKQWLKQLSVGPYRHFFESIFDQTVKQMKSADEILGVLKNRSAASNQILSGISPDQSSSSSSSSSSPSEDSSSSSSASASKSSS